MELFKLRPTMKITADFSHRTCVTESFLENCSGILQEAIRRTKHIHARVGHTQSPQIPDPRLISWQYPVEFFFKIWKQIVRYQKSQKAAFFTITTEFGPPPYMWTKTKDDMPIENQWEINRFMKDLLRKRFDASRNPLSNNIKVIGTKDGCTEVEAGSGKYGFTVK